MNLLRKLDNYFLGVSLRFASGRRATGFAFASVLRTVLTHTLRMPHAELPSLPTPQKFIAFFLLANPTFAQPYIITPSDPRCVFYKNFTEKYQQQARDAFEKTLRTAIQSARMSAEQDETLYQLPYIVHIIHGGEPIGIGTNIDARQVYSQIQATNADFRRRNPDTTATRSVFRNVAADLNIELVPALYAPDGTPLEEPGIHRYNGGKFAYSFDEVNNTIKLNTSWNPDQYLNIWVVRFFIGSSESTLGYSTFPFAPSAASDLTYNFPAHEEGVFVHYKVFGSKELYPGSQLKSVYTKGRTLTHELGHFLGLYHVWGDDYSCNGNDYCDDTPTSRTDYNQLTCPSTTALSCETGKLDMWENYLFYSPDGCMNIFTNDQKQRMRRVLELGTRRKGLLTSTVAKPKTITANFRANRHVCQSIPVHFQNISMVANPTDSIISWEWSFPGANPSASTLREPSVIYNNQGSYNVRLIVQTLSGKRDTLLRNNYMTVEKYDYQPIAENILLQENFADVSSSNPLPIGWQQIVSNAWNYSTASATDNTTGSIMADNANVSLAEQRNRQMYLFAPSINTQAETLFVSFDFAHSLAPSRTNYDTLSVIMRNVCTNELFPLFRLGGSQLAISTQRANFTPTSSAEWRSIGAIFRPQKQGVWQLIFQNIGNGNNRIFLDNITIKTEGRAEDFILAYPNPTSGVLNVLSNLTIYSVKLYDLYGHFLNELPYNSDIEKLDFSTVPNGIYVVVFQTSDGAKRFKICVIR